MKKGVGYIAPMGIATVHQMKLNPANAMQRLRPAASKPVEIGAVSGFPYSCHSRSVKRRRRSDECKCLDSVTCVYLIPLHRPLARARSDMFHGTCIHPIIIGAHHPGRAEVYENAHRTGCPSGDAIRDVGSRGSWLADATLLPVAGPRWSELAAPICGTVLTQGRLDVGWREEGCCDVHNYSRCEDCYLHSLCARQ